MSAQHPECPVTIPKNCPEYMNARVCALCRADKKCLRNRMSRSRERIDVVGLGSPHESPVSSPMRNVDRPRVKKGRSSIFTRYDS